MFTLAISCLTTSNLPWFMDLTFQVPMRYCSLQHQTLLLSPVTSTTGCCFCFGSICSFFLELFLFLHWSPVAYWEPTNLGSSSFSVLSSWLFILFVGFLRQEYWSGLLLSSPVDHILSDLSTMRWPSWVALHTAWLAAAAKLRQSRPTLCDPIDGSPPGSPVPGILQARTLERVAISFSKASKSSQSVVSDSQRPHGAALSMGFPRQEYWSGGTAWLSFIELVKAVVPVIRLASFLWLWFQSVCPLRPSLSAFRLTGFLLPWMRGISSQLLQQSTAAALDLGRGVSPWGHHSWLWMWGILICGLLSSFFIMFSRFIRFWFNKGAILDHLGHRCPGLFLFITLKRTIANLLTYLMVHFTVYLFWFFNKKLWNLELIHWNIQAIYGHRTNLVFLKASP